MGAALGSYWIYQHAGNLAPHELEGEEALAGDPGRRRDRPTARSSTPSACAPTSTRAAARWSYARDLGPARFVAIDSRGARQLDPEDRRMVDRPRVGVDRGAGRRAGTTTSCSARRSRGWMAPGPARSRSAGTRRSREGAGGTRRAACLGEPLRQAYDLEHWPA